MHQPVPGSEIVGSAELRESEHKKNKTKTKQNKKKTKRRNLEISFFPEEAIYAHNMAYD